MRNDTRASVARRSARRRAYLMATVEGQIAEICRSVEVEAKRMRRLLEQAAELRSIVREWAGHAEPPVTSARTRRAKRR